MLKISLKAARTNAGFSQEDVARELNVSKKTIHNWENGTTFPRPDKIDALCELYKMSYDDINFLPTNSLKGNC